MTAHGSDSLRSSPHRGNTTEDMYMDLDEILIQKNKKLLDGHENNRNVSLTCKPAGGQTSEAEADARLSAAAGSTADAYGRHPGSGAGGSGGSGGMGMDGERQTQTGGQETGDAYEEGRKGRHEEMEENKRIQDGLWGGNVSFRAGGGKQEEEEDRQFEYNGQDGRVHVATAAAATSLSLSHSTNSTNLPRRPHRTLSTLALAALAASRAESLGRGRLLSPAERRSAHGDFINDARILRLPSATTREWIENNRAQDNNSVIVSNSVSASVSVTEPSKTITATGLAQERRQGGPQGGRNDVGLGHEGWYGGQQRLKRYNGDHLSQTQEDPANFSHPQYLDTDTHRHRQYEGDNHNKRPSISVFDATVREHYASTPIPVTSSSEPESSQIRILTSRSDNSDDQLGAAQQQERQKPGGTAFPNSGPLKSTDQRIKYQRNISTPALLPLATVTHHFSISDKGGEQGDSITLRHRTPSATASFSLGKAASGLISPSEFDPSSIEGGSKDSLEGNHTKAFSGRKVDILDTILASYQLLHTHTPPQGTDRPHHQHTRRPSSALSASLPLLEQYDPSDSLSSSSLLSRSSFIARTKLDPSRIGSSASSTTSTARPSPLPLISPSPRRTPYPPPLASARSVPLLTPSLLKSSRPRIIGNMTSSSSTTSVSQSHHNPVQSSPALPTTPTSSLPGTPPHQRTPPSRLGSPSPSMSFSGKRRRAPEWPSPRYNKQSASSHGGAGQNAGREGQMTGILAGSPTPTGTGTAMGTGMMTADLSQTIKTPAVLNVPPSPLYSPAFWRQGYAQPPSSASFQGSRQLAAPVQIAHPHHTVSNGNGHQRPLSPRHPPYPSAPPLSTPRLVTPGSVPSSAGRAGRERVNLINVPKGWVIEQLNKRAGQYWHDPTSSDVRVLVPIPRSQAATTQPRSDLPDSAMSAHSNQPTSGAAWQPDSGKPDVAPAGEMHEDQGLLGHVTPGGSAGSGSRTRRGSLPAKDDVVVLVYPLHQDYLVTQSTLFRALLTSSASHLDTHHAPSAVMTPQQPVALSQQQTEASGDGDAHMLDDTPSHSNPTPASPIPASQVRRSPPRTIKGARLLPTLPGEPLAVYLPLPDPASFSVIIHWLYWGNTAALESALNRGMVSWQGVVKNVHALGLDDSVKRLLGKWWRRWVKTDEGRARERGGRGRGGGGVSGSAGIGRGVGGQGWESDDDDDGDGDVKEDETEGDQASVIEDEHTNGSMDWNGKQHGRYVSPAPPGDAEAQGGAGGAGVEGDAEGVVGLMSAL